MSTKSLPRHPHDTVDLVTFANDLLRVQLRSGNALNRAMECAHTRDPLVQVRDAAKWAAATRSVGGISSRPLKDAVECAVDPDLLLCDEDSGRMHPDDERGGTGPT